MMDVPGDSWEERMAARTRARWTRDLEAEERDREARAWSRKRAAEMSAYNAAATLGDALDWLNQPPWGCACVGGPSCCIGRTDRALALQRAAHIAVKLMADRRDRIIRSN